MSNKNWTYHKSRPKKQQQDKPPVTMTLKSTRCKVYSLAEVQRLGLKPLVTYQDKAMVPDWTMVMLGGEGWNKELQSLREQAYAALSGQKMERPKTGKPVDQTPELFDTTQYKV